MIFKKYKSPEVGHEITCTFLIKDKNLLNNKNGKLKGMLEDALINDNFTILGWEEHQFKPKGYSCIALLQESHADFHTYPEHNSLVFNMYSCRGENDVRPTLNYIRIRLGNPEVLFYNDIKIPITKKSAKELLSFTLSS